MTFQLFQFRVNAKKTVPFVLVMSLVGSLSFEHFGAAAQIAQVSNSALQNLLGRSPGERSGIDSIKGKLPDANTAGLNQDVSLVDNGPTERALGQVFDAPVPTGGADSLGAPLSSIPLLDNLAAPSIVATVPSESGVIVDSAPALGGGLLPGFSNIGGSAPLPSGVVIPPVNGVISGDITPIPSAVPEPSAWTMMLVGFGLVGATIRRSEKRSTIAKT